MEENHIKKQSSSSDSIELEPKRESSKSIAAPLIGAALGGLFLLFVLRNRSSSVPNNPDLADDPDLKNFKEAVSNITFLSSPNFFYNVRSSLNSTSIHDLDLLLSISIYPLLTSTVTRAISAMKNGSLKTFDDVRLYVFMNLFMKIRKDRSTVPFIQQAVIGHRATFLTSSNAAFDANDLMFLKYDIMSLTPGSVYNGVNYMVRSTVPFPLHDDNPLYAVNPPQGYRLVQFPLAYQPSDKWNQVYQTVTEDHLYPNLRNSDNSSLASSSAVESFILDSIRSDPSEYYDGYFLNIAKSSGWLEEDDFYLHISKENLKISEDSNAYFVLASGLKVKTESEFINALVNSNTLLPLAHSSFYDISQRFASFEGNYGSIITLFGTSETVFGHFLDLSYSGDHWSADRMRHTNTLTNFAQLGLEILDPIIRSALRHSRFVANNYFPQDSFVDFIDDDISSSIWKNPLFVVEMRKHVYLKPRP